MFGKGRSSSVNGKEEKVLEADAATEVTRPVLKNRGRTWEVVCQGRNACKGTKFVHCKGGGDDCIGESDEFIKKFYKSGEDGSTLFKVVNCRGHADCLDISSGSEWKSSEEESGGSSGSGESDE